MIIDVHSHDFPDAIATRAMNGMCRMIDGHLWPAGDGTLATHLASMAMSGVDMAVSCPVATKPTMFEGIYRRAVGIMNGEFGEEARRKIIPFASIHPLDPQAMEHLEMVAKAGIRGIKIHCFYQDFSLADRTFWPIFGKIADLGLVVQSHSGLDLGWNFCGLCGPKETETLLKNVRGLKFIAAHLGGCDGYPQHATDGLMECGCYIDVSALHRRWHYDEQMRILRSWPTERILFGTDYPWENPAETIRWVKSVREPADWDALFGGNAMRLLKVEC